MTRGALAVRPGTPGGPNDSLADNENGPAMPRSQGEAPAAPVSQRAAAAALQRPAPAIVDGHMDSQKWSSGCRQCSWDKKLE